MDCYYDNVYRKDEVKRNKNWCNDSNINNNNNNCNNNNNSSNNNNNNNNNNNKSYKLTKTVT